MTQLFTTDPDPPVAGQIVIICYSGTLPFKGTITINGGDPQAMNSSVECWEYEVPSNATSFLLHDDSGESDDFPRVL